MRFTTLFTNRLNTNKFILEIIDADANFKKTLEANIF